jgi:hypothetical protein
MIETMKQALEALTREKWFRSGLGERNNPKVEAAIAALSAAIEAAEKQEPVAWMYESVCGNDFATRHKPPDYAKNIRPLYTIPPAAAQPAPVPIKGAVLDKHGGVTLCQNGHEESTFGFAGRLFATPPAAAQRQWVGLTDEEIDEWTPEIHSVIQAIEAKLKERNT